MGGTRIPWEGNQSGIVRIFCIFVCPENLSWAASTSTLQLIVSDNKIYRAHKMTQGQPYSRNVASRRNRASRTRCTCTGLGFLLSVVAIPYISQGTTRKTCLPSLQNQAPTNQKSALRGGKRASPELAGDTNPGSQ